MKSCLTLLFLSLILSSCGGSKSSSAPAPVIEPIATFETKEKLMQALEASTVRCARTNECPSNVAKLSFWAKVGDQFGLGVCSGTLVNENYIITNAHCVPDNLRAGDDCSMQIKVQFPRSSRNSSENVRCERVVQKYNQPAGEPDIAVLKVETSRYNRKHTPLVGNQFHSNRQFVAYTMNPGIRNVLSGTIIKKTCNISLNNLLTFDISSTSGNALIYGGNCNVIKGNSGSALFNDVGEMVGVIHQKIEKKVLRNTFRDNQIPYGSFTYMGVVANISCLRSLSTNSGVGCSYHAIGSHHSEIDSYLQRLIRLNKLENVPTKDIELTINDRLEVSLRQNDDVSVYNSFRFIRGKLVSIFMDSKNLISRFIVSLI